MLESATNVAADMATYLLVADVPWVVNDVKAVLNRAEDVIHELANPREAVEAAGDLGADAVIVDLQVGSMGGMAVTRALKDAIAGKQIPAARLVMLLDRTADRFLAKRAGASAAVVKPFTAADLRRAVAG